MFYRRKILLSLIEIFGRRLNRTDLQKLLFLYCVYSKNNYYDFFPYHFGSFSFIVSQDKAVLTKYGYLEDCKDYVLDSEHHFIDELNEKDYKNLKSFHNEFKDIKRKALIRYAYLNHPEYTIKSKILHDILKPSEIKHISLWRNIDESMHLFSIGYEGLTIDGYLRRLILNNIKALIDVRKNPLSMKYGFSKTRFKKYLEKTGIKYIHMPELGVPSNLRQKLNNWNDYQILFKYYKKEILPEKKRELSLVEAHINNHKRVALTCFEKDHQFCHRNKITEYFESEEKYNFPITHI